jgi:hypothetical protein
MSVETTLTPNQASRLERWSERRREPVKRAWQGLCSPRAAIKLFCLECTGEDVESVRLCPARTCPLWKYRPFQKKTNSPGGASPALNCVPTKAGNSPGSAL